MPCWSIAYNKPRTCSLVQFVLQAIVRLVNSKTEDPSEEIEMEGLNSLEAKAHEYQLDDLEIIEISSSGDDTDCTESPDEERTPRYKNIVHLWEFLLELLADESCKSVITWSRKMHGEFKLKDPNEIATRWGRFKHRPGMTYEKLSRALRHYYSKGIIKKVKGQRLVYKFHILPYEYTPGKSRSQGTSIPTMNTIRQDEKNYKGFSPCSKTSMDGSEQRVLDKERMRRFFEERLLNNTRNKNKSAFIEQQQQTPLPTASPERSPTQLPSEECFQPVVPVAVPIPVRPSSRSACGCEIWPLLRPVYRSPIILPISAYKQRDSVSYGLNNEVTSIPVSVIRISRS